MAFPILAALGVGASIANGIAGAIGQSSANRQNRDLAREQMSFNAAEAQKEREWQERMMMESRDYYSEQNQVARLRAAGLNPYLNTPAGNVDSTMSGANASSSALPSMQAVNPMSGLGSVPSSVMLDAQLRNTDANTAKLSAEGVSTDIANDTAQLRYMAELAETYTRIKQSDMDADLKAAQLDMLRRELDFYNDTYDMRKQSVDLNNQLTSAHRDEMASASALNSARQITEDTLREWSVKISKATIAKIQQDIKESSARIDDIMADAELKGESVKEVAERVKTESERRAKIIAERIGIDNSNKQYPQLVRKVESEIWRNYVTTKSYGPIKLTGNFGDNNGAMLRHQVDEYLNGSRSGRYRDINAEFGLE